jgi:N-acetylglutamate synthase-like GNAT family acetyltransferase
MMHQEKDTDCRFPKQPALFASMSIEEIGAAKTEGQVLFQQVRQTLNGREASTIFILTTSHPHC